jgi:hypothetical protein
VTSTVKAHKHTAKTRGDAAISPRVLPKTAAVKVSARIREGDRESKHHYMGLFGGHQRALFDVPKEAKTPGKFFYLIAR